VSKGKKKEKWGGLTLIDRPPATLKNAGSGRLEIRGNCLLERAGSKKGAGQVW